MFPKKIIFVGIGQTQIEFLEQLRRLHHEAQNWVYINSQHEIPQHLENHPLIVNCSNREISDLIYKAGSGYCIEWEDFLKYNHTLTHTTPLLSLRNVGLAFLPKPEENIIASIFSLYGHSVTLIHTEEELYQAIEGGVSYLAANIDFPEQLMEERNQLLRRIKNAVYFGPKITVNLIKDFNRGSLYDDLASPAKEFCNMILSPQEYILFIKRYLYRQSNQKLNSIYSTIEEPRGAPSYGDGENKVFHNLFSPLKNFKAGFLQTQLPEGMEQRRQYREDLEAIDIRNSLLEWLEPYLENLDKEQAEGLFTFAPGQIGQKEQIEKIESPFVAAPDYQALTSGDPIKAIH